MSRSQEEFRFQCVVARWLDVAVPKRIPWTAFPAGENRSAITGSRLKNMGLHKGWPDILIYHEGVLIGLELKAGKGKPSDEQTDVGERIVEQWGRWSVCRTLDAVEFFLRDCGVPLLVRAPVKPGLMVEVGQAA